MYNVDELVRKEKKGTKTIRYYFIPDDNKWYYSNLVKRRLKELGYSVEHYYNKYFLGIDDPDYRPKCKLDSCNNQVKFNKTGIIEDGYNGYCSLNHARINNWSTDSYRDNYRNSEKRKYSNENSMKEFHKNKDKHDRWKRNRSKFDESGGAFGYMYKNPDKFSKFIKMTTENGGMLNILRRRNPDFGLVNLDENSKSIHLKKTVKGYKCGVFKSIKSERSHYRSSYELKFIELIEGMNEVVKFRMEPARIPYQKPSDNMRIHYYYPDSLLYLDNGVKVLVEIKPSVFITDSDVVNKYIAMSKYCADNGYRCVIITENLLFDSEFNNKFLRLIGF